MNVESVLSIYETLYPLEGMRYVFLDEIQYTGNWELWMKVTYDSRKDICLVATSSANPVIERGSADSGTGRWSVLKVPAMSFYEYCRLLELPEPALPKGLRLTKLVELPKRPQRPESCRKFILRQRQKTRLSFFKNCKISKARFPKQIWDFLKIIGHVLWCVGVGAQGDDLPA